jgi:O-antigen ligase
MIPLSVLSIKYFPEIGRGFEAWTGEPINRGIALNKNELGYGCMIFGIFFYWHLITTYRSLEQPYRRIELLVSLVFLAMILWLLKVADSATSLVTLLMGVATIAVLGQRSINKQFLGTYVVLAILLAAAIESTFGVYELALKLLGRDPTLTDRTDMWVDALALAQNPLLGTGFESFWLGPRLAVMWEKWPWQPNQAHNGYIETYLNLGYIGVIILGGLLVSTFRKISQQSVHDLDFARLRMGFFVAILFYNFTEAAFKAVHLVWTVFHIIAIQYASKSTSGTPAHSARCSTIYRGQKSPSAANPFAQGAQPRGLLTRRAKRP